MALSSSLFLSLLLVTFATVRSSPPLLPHSAIDYNVFPFASRQSRGCPSLPFKSSISGYIRASTFGVTVTRGATASISFSITISGIPARNLANVDGRYQQALPSSLRKIYMSRRKAYKGGLDIPFLADLGADLNKLILRGKEVRKRNRFKKAYGKRVCAASKILEKVRGSKVRVEGSRKVTGNSFIPKTVFGFVKVAKIKTLDGTVITIVSTDPRDFAVATKDGILLSTGADGVQVKGV